MGRGKAAIGDPAAGQGVTIVVGDAVKRSFEVGVGCDARGAQLTHIGLVGGVGVKGAAHIAGRGRSRGCRRCGLVAAGVPVEVAVGVPQAPAPLRMNGIACAAAAVPVSITAA